MQRGTSTSGWLAGTAGAEICKSCHCCRPKSRKSRHRWPTKEFTEVKSGNVLLQSQFHEGGPSRTIRLRRVPRPDEAQKVLLSHMGLTLPRRLRRMDDIANAQATVDHRAAATILTSHTSELVASLGDETNSSDF